jgi:hypothetical protein
MVVTWTADLSLEPVTRVRYSPLETRSAARRLQEHWYSGGLD